MSMEKCDHELVQAFVKAVSNSFSSLKSTHDEQFYYYAFIFDSGLHPYISAWSYEALEKSIYENEIVEEDEKNWWKWDYADSPYVVYGYEEFFCEVNELLDQRAEGLSEEALYGREWNIRIASMEEAMKRLDRTGFFGTGSERKNVVVNVEAAPPDGEEYDRALRLNPGSPLLDEYLNCCEEPDSD